MKNQRRFAPAKTGRLAPEQVAAFLRNQWPESAEYATKEEKSRYSEPEALRDILKRVFSGQKYRLDCGHHTTLFHPLGNDITILNGKEPKIICSLCGH